MTLDRFARFSLALVASVEGLLALLLLIVDGERTAALHAGIACLLATYILVTYPRATRGAD